MLLLWIYQVEYKQKFRLNDEKNFNNYT